jgi:hypothetical protein
MIDAATIARARAVRIEAEVALSNQPTARSRGPPRSYNEAPAEG